MGESLLSMGTFSSSSSSSPNVMVCMEMEDEEVVGLLDVDVCDVMGGCVCMEVVEEEGEGYGCCIDLDVDVCDVMGCGGVVCMEVEEEEDGCGCCCRGLEDGDVCVGERGCVGVVEEEVDEG